MDQSVNSRSHTLTELGRERCSTDGCCQYPATNPAANFGPGPQAVAEGRSAILTICFSASLTADFGPGPAVEAEGRSAGRGRLLLSMPTSGLARRGRRKGAHLDGEFAFYASRPPTSGLARRRRRRGAQLDGAFAFYASRPDFWHGPEAAAKALVAGRRWTGRLLSTPLAPDFGPGPERASEG